MGSGKNFGLIKTAEEWAKFCSKLIEDGKPFGFDIETGYDGQPRDGAALHPETAKVVGISISNSTDWARYVPLAHDLGENVDNVEAARSFWPVLQTGLGIAHNAKFELRHLSSWFREFLIDDPEFGEVVRASRGYFPILSDSLIEAYMVAEHKYFGLKYLTDQMFNHKMTELHELFPLLAKNKRKTLRFNTLELTPQVVEYACEDALWCLAIHNKYYPMVQDMLLFKTELAIIPILCDMEDYGVKYDWNYMRKGAERASAFLDKMNAEIQSELSVMAGRPVAVNLGSPAQVSAILYEELKMVTNRVTKGSKNSGAPKMSTDAIALAGLAKKHPVVQKILEWKEMKTLCTRYLEKYEHDYSYADDGMTHPNYMQCAVITGRFAVSDPPVQQSPKKYRYLLNAARVVDDQHKKEHGKNCKCKEFPLPEGQFFEYNFRDAIVAPKDHYIMGYDLSQAELRAIAGEAQETALINAFNNNIDVHCATASLMLKIPLETVIDDYKNGEGKLRDVGKTLNFALGYGMQAKSLADRIPCSVDEAKDLFNKYFAAYPSLAVWTERQVKIGKENGYVKSKFGRRLPIWEFQSTDHWIYSKGERGCVNFPIQGAATGDFMKIAMVRADKAIKKAGLQDRVHMMMNMHDALEFYVHKSVRPEKVMEVLLPAVVFPVDGWPKMRADWHIGAKWGSMKELKMDEDGNLTIAGEKVMEQQSPGDDEEGEGDAGQAIPKVDLEVIRAAIGQEPKQENTRYAEKQGKPHYESSIVDEDAPGKKVIVEFVDMPEEAAYRRFVAVLHSKPGNNTVMLKTPEGEMDMELSQGTGLSPSDQAQVSMILGGARVYYAAEDVDTGSMLTGIVL